MTVDELVQLVEGLTAAIGDVGVLRFGPPEPVDFGKELSNDEWVILVRFLAGERPEPGEMSWAGIVGHTGEVHSLSLLDSEGTTLASSPISVPTNETEPAPDPEPDVVAKKVDLGDGVTLGL